jgi:dihydropyrimidine dehydrogenase (NAD+) subunit PreA
MIFCGIELAHPVLNGSGTFDAIAARRAFGDALLEDFPFAAFVSKTITLRPRAGNPPPRLFETAAGMLNSIGLPNKGLEGYLREDLPQLAELPVPLITNVMGSTGAELAALTEAVGERDEVAAVELNVSCPNVKTGLDIGAVPAELERVMRAVRPRTAKPVIVKLTPNTADVAACARAAQDGGADAVSLINTINSVMGVNLDTLVPHPNVNGMAAHGGYCGPAVKPIALNMVTELARDPEVTVPISGIGGISTWRDAAEFLLLGASSVQVCTAVMHHGYRIVEDMIDGLSNYMDEKGFATVRDMAGASARRVTDWGNLDLNYKTVARIDHAKCIQCNLCHVACEDGAHQCIPLTQINGARYPVVDEAECVGCNLCYLVCPVPGCISMVRLDDGSNPLTWRELSSRPPETMTAD